MTTLIEIEGARRNTASDVVIAGGPTTPVNWSAVPSGTAFASEFLQTQEFGHLGEGGTGTLRTTTPLLLLETVRFAHPWLIAVQRRLATFSALVPDEGFTPPTKETSDRAEELLFKLDEINFEPDRIVPSADGGVSVVFSVGPVYADIEFLNDGDTLAVISAPESDPIVWEIESTDQLDAAIERIREQAAN